ncbi:acetate/propionate family kinase [Mycoplana dimorpha]|uniref:Acetate kinase n=1 Tax=Mycoplana dimorpha TaxID=28320 RepID=A0A2T5B5C2_MYCDI|nr:acetate/propionate family kinase [Mycoplana dimorpha]PTM94186.1 acetate kinase [Mycoplana dimorpha]
MDTILVVNAGSSSLKFEVFSVTDDLNSLLEGQMEGIGSAPHLRIKDRDGRVLAEHTHASADVPDLPSAILRVGAWLRDQHEGDLVAVGHRVVHGGPDYDRPVLVNEQIVSDLERYVPLAPLHQPHNLTAIRAVIDRRPDLPQVACFDTSFHRNHSPVTSHYAIPEHFFAEGVRRYGFHGLSYEYVAGRLREVAPSVAGGKLIVAHLGNGASLCAISGGRSIESTFGFTALDGIPMGARCGQIDPGVLLYLLQQKGMSADEVQDLLYKESGLKGLSGVSNDVRALLSSEDPRAAFALEHFVHRIGLHAGMLAAALGGLDAFVFTAGIGENSPDMRARVAARLEWLGARIDPVRNAAGALDVAASDSAVRLYVVPTDEELMIARHTMALLRGG